MASRRKLLSGVTSSIVLSLSGCMFGESSNDSSILDCVEVVSRSDKHHTVDFRVDFEGEEVFADSYDIDPWDPMDEKGIQQQWVEPDWPEDPGRFKVHIRLDDRSEWQTIDSTAEYEEYEDSAVHIQYRIGGTGNGIPVWGTSNIDEYERDCSESLWT